MDHPYLVCAFKVDVRTHCEDCVVKAKNLKKMLLKIDGVEDVIIDVEEKTVITSGTAQPETILTAIKTKFKEAKQSSSRVHEKDNSQVEQMYPMGNYMPHMQKWIDGHICENYEPKGSKCRNALCKTHSGGLFIKLSDNPQHHGGFAQPLATDMHYQPMYPMGNYRPPMQMHFQQPYDKELPFGPIGRQVPHGPFGRQVPHGPFGRQVPHGPFGRQVPHGPFHQPSQMALPYYDQHGPWQ